MILSWRIRRPFVPISFLLILSMIFGLTALAQTPTLGAVEFTATVRPTDGRAEPVRDMPFYLLRKSLSEIRKQVERAEGPASMQSFVDGLAVSSELKEWMKKYETVQLAGSEFTKRLTADDVIGVPEFFEAYSQHNGSGVGAGPPAPKYKESDRQSNPEKYRKAREQYHHDLRKYIVANPDSIHGIDAQLTDVNPAQTWLNVQAGQRQRIERRALALAETEYLAMATSTDLSGRGAFTGIAPGVYSISTLGTPALAGDARVLWDLTVTVEPGEVTRIELSNLNALESTNRATH